MQIMFDTNGITVSPVSNVDPDQIEKAEAKALRALALIARDSYESISGTKTSITFEVNLSEAEVDFLEETQALGDT